MRTTRRKKDPGREGKGQKKKSTHGGHKQPPGGQPGNRGLRKGKSHDRRGQEGGTGNAEQEQGKARDGSRQAKDRSQAPNPQPTTNATGRHPLTHKGRVKEGRRPRREPE